MWGCQGKAVNLNEALMGKVTREGRLISSRRKHIYVCEKGYEKKMLYAGVLTSQETIVGYEVRRQPCVYGINAADLSHLSEGDIVLVEPTGRVNLVWEARSNHNALMATEECNCNCMMCPQPPRRDPEGQQDYNMRLIELADPKTTVQVGISGGEPTLLGEGLFKLILACKKKLPKASVQLLSNGRLFKNLDFSKRMVELQHPNLTICIALYADTDKEHDRIVGAKGSFYDTIKGLENLALLRQQIEIRNVMQLQNYRRLPQFAQFVYHNLPFVIHVAFMGLEVTGSALMNINEVWVDPVKYMPGLEAAVTYLHRREMGVSIYNLQLCIIPTTLWGFSRKSISPWKNVFLADCGECCRKDDCCGFFGTSGGWKSKHIRPIKTT